MNKRIARRHRLLLITSLLAGVVLVTAGLLAFYKRPDDRYDPRRRQEGITAELERMIPSDYPRVTFSEASAEAALTFQHFWQQRSTQLPEDMGSGAAWGDYDNDGDDDLFLVNFAGPITLGRDHQANSPAFCRLYRNNGDGTFSDATAAAKLGLPIYGMAAAWGDWDGDGFLDLVVTSYPDLLLFRNNGDGSFADVSAPAGFDRYKGFWSGASWADFDRDGDLDLYVCGYVQYRSNAEDAQRVSLQFEAEVPYSLNPSSYPPERNLLFRNEGGRFTEIARNAGVDNPGGRSLAAAWCDFDGDGWLDLYVANDVSDNVLFRNLTKGKFEDISHAAWVADYRGAMGLAVGDFDVDGDFDIFVTHWLAQENALFRNMRIGALGSKPGKMVFMDVADQEGLGQVSLDYVKWGTSFFDYDNDTRPDLLVVHGSTFQDPKDKRQLIPMRQLLFWNKGESDGFFETGTVSGPIFQQKSVGRGAAFSDYDNDGDVDVCIINHGGPAWLLRNEGGNRQAWLKVKVSGRKNRFGLGALVKVRTGERVQIQQVGSQPSYLSQNSLALHFGLGKAETIDQLIVEFPGGPSVEKRGLKPRQTIVIEEP
jgi:hypothetical protein